MIDPNHITYFQRILDNQFIEQDSDSILLHSSDYTGEFSFSADLVLRPSNTEEVSQILAYCNTENIPVTPRGAGTSLSAGSVPTNGGVVLLMDRFNHILEIDVDNFQATVEPGVINQIFAEEVEKHGLFYPPDPASKGSCFMGGNVAHASGGPRCIKYGTTRDYILNLEVVLADGQIIQTGANTLKYSSGYNLTHLFIGSEGTLGVITKIRTKLIPLPKERILLSVGFESLETACKSVNDILRANITPSAIEFMDREAILFTQNFLYHQTTLSGTIQAQLLIELDGNRKDILLEEAAIINDVLEANGCSEVFFAESALEMDRLWTLRRKVGEAVRASTVFKEEDTVIPRAGLPQLVAYIKELEKEFGFKTVIFGHAGDGNLHINILKQGLTDDFWHSGLTAPIRLLFEKCKSLGGTISGEHGIGYTQKPYMDILFPPHHIALFKGIKSAFDPKGILNKGKMV